jgi:hypothetical protein
LILSTFQQSLKFAGKQKRQYNSSSVLSIL